MTYVINLLKEQDKKNYQLKIEYKSIDVGYILRKESDNGVLCGIEIEVKIPEVVTISDREKVLDVTRESFEIAQIIENKVKVLEDFDEINVIKYRTNRLSVSITGLTITCPKDSIVNGIDSKEM